MPASLKRIDFVIEIAGRRIEESIPCPCSASSQTSFLWDGKDAFGRELQGEQPATVRIGYVYDGVYVEPPTREAVFGAWSSETVTASATRNELTLWKDWRGRLGGLRALPLRLGGWTLSAHHVYSPAAQVLYLGDGRRRACRGGVVRSRRRVAEPGACGYSDAVPGRARRSWRRPVRGVCSTQPAQNRQELPDEKERARRTAPPAREAGLDEQW